MNYVLRIVLCASVIAILLGNESCNLNHSEDTAGVASFGVKDTVMVVTFTGIPRELAVTYASYEHIKPNWWLERQTLTIARRLDNIMSISWHTGHIDVWPEMKYPPPDFTERVTTIPSFDFDEGIENTE